MSISNDQALLLLQNLGVLLLLDVPVGTEIGVDYKTWTTGSKFRGVKLIPCGVHFITYSAKGKSDGATGILTGFFVYIESKDIIVKKWDESIEGFSPDESMDEEERGRYKEGVRNFHFDDGLAPFQFNEWEEWKGFSNFITKDVLQRFLSDEKCDFSSHNIKYTPLPLRTILKDSLSFENTAKKWSPEEITKYNVDSSDFLETMSDEFLLGELQMSFVDFLLGQSFDGLTQWKNLVDMILRADKMYCTSSLSHRNATILTNALAVIMNQLEKVPKDFFVDEISKDNFLKKSLSSFFMTAYEVGESDSINEQLFLKMNELKEFSRSHFLFFDIDEREDDEDKPTIVEM